MQSSNSEIGTARHIMLSSGRGVITEIEQVRADDYVIRYHTSAADIARMMDAGSWVGFRYGDDHWSFVKK